MRTTSIKAALKKYGLIDKPYVIEDGMTKSKCHSCRSGNISMLWTEEPSKEVSLIHARINGVKMFCTSIKQATDFIELMTKQ